MIDVSDIDLRKLIKTAYRLSYPQGLGHLHYRPGELDEETLDQILEHPDVLVREMVSLDYVHGRAVKLHVTIKGDKKFIHDHWFDHSEEQLATLLNEARK